MYFYCDKSHWKTTANLYHSNYNKEIYGRGIFKSLEPFEGVSLGEDTKVKLSNSHFRGKHYNCFINIWMYKIILNLGG